MKDTVIHVMSIQWTSTWGSKNVPQKWGYFGVEHFMKKYRLANCHAGCATISSCAEGFNLCYALFLSSNQRIWFQFYWGSQADPKISSEVGLQDGGFSFFWVVPLWHFYQFLGFLVGVCKCCHGMVSEWTACVQRRLAHLCLHLQ